MRLKASLVGAVAVAALAGCGGSDDNAGSSGGGGTGGAAAPKGAKKAPTLAASKSAKGNVIYCTGKDTSGAQKKSIADFNKKYASQGLSAKIFEFPESADEQRNQFVQRQRAKSGECDIFFSDVIWTAEFAAQKWLLDMSDYIKTRAADFIPSTLQSNKVGTVYFGVPQATDAGFIYYRTDRVKQLPSTWQGIYQQAKSKGGIVYQGKSYEGLTVDFLEIAFAAGGKVLSPDGKKAMIDSPQNLKALEFMVDGIKSGAAPKAVTTYGEEEAKRAFESGKPAFQRQWPYAYVPATKAPKIKGRFKVAPLPSFAGAGKAGILGGHNIVISSYSKNPKGAMLLTDFITSPQIQKQNAAKFSIAPVLSATYDDAAVKKALPFAAELKQAVTQAKARPVSAVYPQISEAIYKNVNKALSGSESPKAALSAAQSQIEKALQTF
jgi:multiple sugar transport system substrate-binding protein